VKRNTKPRVHSKAESPGGLSLAERIKARDASALLEMFACSAPALLAMAKQVTGDAEEAGEAVEQAFVGLWKESHRAHGGLTPEVWLVLESRRIALRKRAARFPADTNPEQATRRPHASGVELPGTDCIAQLESRRPLLKKVLRQLPKQQYAALCLAVWEGLSEPEIAARLGEPLARVQASLRAGMRFIRHRMSVVLGRWSVPI
jgi:RNA polymerase sigma-70 factor (ECF subfamily)